MRFLNIEYFLFSKLVGRLLHVLYFLFAHTSIRLNILRQSNCGESVIYFTLNWLLGSKSLMSLRYNHTYEHILTKLVQVHILYFLAISAQLLILVVLSSFFAKISIEILVL